MFKHTLISVAALLALTVAAPAAIACNVFAGLHVAGAAADSKMSLGGLQDGGANITGGLGASLGCRQALGKGWSIAPVISGEIRKFSDGSSVFSTFGVGGGEANAYADATVHLGYMLSNAMELYALGGWGWVWRNDLEAGGNHYNMPTGSGPVLGFGSQYAITKRLHLDSSYRVLFTEADAVPSVPIANRFEANEHIFRIGLNYGDPFDGSLFSWLSGSPPAKKK